MTLNFHKKPQRDFVFHFFFKFLLFLIYFICFALYFFFLRHADVHATACWRIGSYAPDWYTYCLRLKCTFYRLFLLIIYERCFRFQIPYDNENVLPLLNRHTCVVNIQCAITKYYTLRFYFLYLSLLAQPVTIFVYMDRQYMDRPGTCIILDKKYNIANSSCHFGSYGNIWTRSFGPYNIFLVTDRSIYCHMTLSAMNYLLFAYNYQMYLQYYF